MNKITTCLWFDHGKAREAEVAPGTGLPFRVQA